MSGTTLIAHLSQAPTAVAALAIASAAPYGAVREAADLLYTGEAPGARTLRHLVADQARA